MSAVSASLPRGERSDTASDTRLSGLAWLTVALVGVGVACRLFRFWLNFPIWADEPA